MLLSGVEQTFGGSFAMLRLLFKREKLHAKDWVVKVGSPSVGY